MSSVDYSKKAMLVKLTRRAWGISKKDAVVTKAVLAQHGATMDSGTFTKKILAKDALKEINTCMNEAYKIHNSMTLPWDDEGRRILTSKNFFEYKRKMNEVENSLALAVKSFISDYPRLVDEAKHRLNGLFNSADYPEPQQLADLFKLQVDPEPVPTGTSLHIEIADEYLQAQRDEIEQRVKIKFNEAHKELYSRLSEVVKHLRDCVVDEKSFKAASVEKVIEVCNAIPSLVIDNDERLLATAQSIADELGKYRVSEIRNNPHINKKVASNLKSQVDTLSQDMAAYFG